MPLKAGTKSRASTEDYGNKERTKNNFNEEQVLKKRAR